MSVNKKRILSFKQKQFVSSRVFNLCRIYGLNTRSSFTYIPGSVLDKLQVGLKESFIDASTRKRELRKRIQHLQTIKTYKGIRHRKGLPVRGQRTHTNAKTRKKGKKFAELKYAESQKLSNFKPNSKGGPKKGPVFKGGKAKK
jgi:small subunit ribosomal protein S13